MAKITTGELYNEWQMINDKLENLNNKVDGIIDGSAPANTQVTGSIVEEIFLREELNYIAPGTNASFVVDLFEYNQAKAFSVTARLDGSDLTMFIRDSYMISSTEWAYSVILERELFKETNVRAFKLDKIDFISTKPMLIIRNDGDTDLRFQGFSLMLWR